VQYTGLQETAPTKMKKEQQTKKRVICTFYKV
jgi:hypothetical protein